MRSGTTEQPAEQSTLMQSGGVELSSCGESALRFVRGEATKAITDIAQGKVRDSEGNTRLPEGEKLSIKSIAGMDFFVPGVEGSLPK